MELPELQTVRVRLGLGNGDELDGDECGLTSVAWRLETGGPCASPPSERRLQPRHFRSGRAHPAPGKASFLINSTAIMLAIIIPTMIATVAFAWWFRRGNSKATYRPDWEYSGAVEMVVWGIPVLTIMRPRRDRLDRKPRPRSGQAAQVERPAVEGRRSLARLEMAVHLPRPGDATVNQLVVPAGTPVNYRLTSATVWNVFSVRRWGAR